MNSHTPAPTHEDVMRRPGWWNLKNKLPRRARPALLEALPDSAGETAPGRVRPPPAGGLGWGSGGLGAHAGKRKAMLRGSLRRPAGTKGGAGTGPAEAAGRASAWPPRLGRYRTARPPAPPARNPAASSGRGGAGGRRRE